MLTTGGADDAEVSAYFNFQSSLLGEFCILCFTFSCNFQDDLVEEGENRDLRAEARDGKFPKASKLLVNGKWVSKINHIDCSVVIYM